MSSIRSISESSIPDLGARARRSSNPEARTIRASAGKLGIAFPCSYRAMADCEVDDHHHDVRAVLGELHVREKLVVVDGQEPQPLVRLQRRVLPADPVDAGDERRQRVLAVQVPLAYLVLLRVQVLLGARPDGLV